MTREEFYKLTDILNSEVLGNFMHGGEAAELIAMFEESVEHSNILEQEEPIGKVWHYQKEEPIDEITDKSRPIVVIYGYNSLNAASKFRCYEDNSEAIWLSNNCEKWAYIDDLIKL